MAKNFVFNGGDLQRTLSYIYPSVHNCIWLPDSPTPLAVIHYGAQGQEEGEGWCVTAFLVFCRLLQRLYTLMEAAGAASMAWALRLMAVWICLTVNVMLSDS